jgi:pimeloyl-ACP methyl ester carboxylesterase
MVRDNPPVLHQYMSKENHLQQRRRWPFVAAALMLITTLLGIANPAAAVETGNRGLTSDDVAQDLDWQPCYEDETSQHGTPFECATLTAPLDYDEISPTQWARGGGRTIGVALIRIPAADPANRMGAILSNPGGPGGSGISFVRNFGPVAGTFFGPDVVDKFDFVGFDPRGIGQSTPVRCFSTIGDAIAISPGVFPPRTWPQERAIRRADRALAAACRSYPGARQMGKHVSTANVARDMDAIRASMGDDSLNFIGLSYGTYVVANYANLYPERVRSVVADGVLDPVAWVNKGGRQPFSSGLGSDIGAADTLAEFFRQCEAAQPGNCAFAPNTEARYDALAARLRDEGPIELPDGTLFLYQDLIGFSLGSLYNPFAYAGLAEGLAFFEAVAFGTGAAGDAPAAVTTALADAGYEEEPYDNFVEGFPAVSCVDTNNPRSHYRWRRAGIAAERANGYFGRLWTWVSSPCATWPFKDNDRYTGPFTAETANPVLVIGNFYDPATPYEGAQALRALLPNSGLLSVDVPGHTSLGSSICAGVITGQYFLNPGVATAVDGQTCPAEFNAFDVVAGGTAAAAADAPSGSSTVDLAAMIEVRTEALPNSGYGLGLNRFGGR